MACHASAARDRCLELERVIAGRARSGSLGLDDALKLFEELLPHARPASVRAFNHLLNAVSRARCPSASELAVSLFNRMARACSDKVYVYKERSSIGSPIMTFSCGVNTSNLPCYLNWSSLFDELHLKAGAGVLAKGLSVTKPSSNCQSLPVHCIFKQLLSLL